MEDAREAPRRSVKEYMGIFLRGICMGAADVVPGVSGGTMALITGIYEELILSIRSFDLPALRLLLSGQWRKAVGHVRWPFLTVLLSGILTAILSLSKLIVWLLDNQPVLVWSFFFGLVVASVFTVGRRIAAWNSATVSGAVLATVGAYFLVGLVPVQTPETLGYVFLSAVIAICAMILPGISGSFMLVLLGKYHDILTAVNNRDLLTLAVFCAGAAVGLSAFSRVLGWIFRRYHDLTVAMLTGLMLGSLRKVWPWKETLTTMMDRHGKVVPLEQINQMPPAWTPEVTAAIALCVFGLVIVLVLEKLAERHVSPEE